MASKQPHGCPFSDMQAICSSTALPGIQRSICRFNVKSMESRLVGNSNARPKRVIQAHCSEELCSGFLIREAMKSTSVGFQKENLRGLTHLMYGVSKGYLKWSSHAERRSHSSCQEATLCDPSVVYESVLTCDRQCFTTENGKGLQASVACSTNGAVQTGIVADFGGMSDWSLFEMHRKPPVLSLGVCGNALVMSVGSNARCFHQQGLACGRGEHMVLDACSEAKRYGGPLVDISGSCSDVSLFPGTTITPKFRADKLRGKTKQKKIGKTSAPTRDLFERSFFHFFEVLFCHPFITMREVPFNSQLPSQESLRELVGITNQAAVGLAGVGVMFLLFVTSRMLCVNAALNKHVLARLAIGVGFLSLSLTMRRVSDVVICMVDDYSRSKRSKKENLINLWKELQRVVLKAIPLLVMCFIGAG